MNRNVPVSFLLLALLVPFLLAPVPSAKSPEKIKQSVRLPMYLGIQPGQTLSLYNVPIGRRFIVSDVILTNTSTSTVAEASLYDGGNLIPWGRFYVQPKSTLMHSFTTGPDFGPGSTVVIGFPAGSGAISGTINGYLVKD